MNQHPPAGRHAVQPSHRSNATVYVLVGFLIGATTYADIEFIGHIYFAEFLLAALGLYGLVFGFFRGVSRGIVRWLIILYAIAVLGYIASDLYVGSDFADYIRGWARLFVLFTDVLGLLALINKNERALLGYLGGIVVAGWLNALINHMPISEWKFGWAEPTTLACILLAAASGRNIGFALCVLISAANIQLDYKSLGLICFVVASALAHFLWMRSSPAAFKGVVVTTVLPLVLIAFAFLYKISYSDAANGERSRGGETERVAAFLTGCKAIVASPLIGYGSWAKDPRYASYFIEMRAELRGDAEEENVARTTTFDQESMQSHSQILQAWTEGGVAAAAFFIWYGYLAASMLWFVVFKWENPAEIIIFSYILASACWDVLFSPFAGNHRLTIGISVALIIYIYSRRKNDRDRLLDRWRWEAVANRAMGITPAR